MRITSWGVVSDSLGGKNNVFIMSGSRTGCVKRCVSIRQALIAFICVWCYTSRVRPEIVSWGFLGFEKNIFILLDVCKFVVGTSIGPLVILAQVLTLLLIYDRLSMTPWLDFMLIVMWHSFHVDIRRLMSIRNNKCHGHFSLSLYCTFICAEC